MDIDRIIEEGSEFDGQDDDKLPQLTNKVLQKIMDSLPNLKGMRYRKSTGNGIPFI